MTWQRLLRRMLVVAVSAMTFTASRAIASDDSETSSQTLSIGDTVEGTFTDQSTSYVFHGKANDIVTITLEGKTVEQIGVVMVRSSKDFDFEWLTANYLDNFPASGNVRDGDKLRLTLRLPETAKYVVYVRDALFQDDDAKRGSYSLTVDGSRAPGKTYVRGTLAGGLATVGTDPTYAFDGTLSVGRTRGAKLGIEGVLGASIIAADETSVLGFLGIGLRVVTPDSPLRLRYAAGFAAMRGLTDQLGGGLRVDVQGKRIGFGMEGARVGRTNVMLAMFGLAL